MVRHNTVQILWVDATTWVFPFLTTLSVYSLSVYKQQQKNVLGCESSTSQGIKTLQFGLQLLFERETFEWCCCALYFERGDYLRVFKSILTLLVSVLTDSWLIVYEFDGTNFSCAAVERKRKKNTKVIQMDPDANAWPLTFVASRLQRQVFPFLFLLFYFSLLSFTSKELIFCHFFSSIFCTRVLVPPVQKYSTRVMNTLGAAVNRRFTPSFTSAFHPQPFDLVLPPPSRAASSSASFLPSFAPSLLPSSPRCFRLAPSSAVLKRSRREECLRS